MVGHGGSRAGSYLADPTSPIPSHCASIVVTSTLRVKTLIVKQVDAIVTVASIPIVTFCNDYMLSAKLKVSKCQTQGVREHSNVHIFFFYAESHYPHQPAEMDN